MRVASFRTTRGEDYGVVVDGAVVPLMAHLPDPPPSLREVLRQGRLGELADVAADVATGVATRLPLDEVEFLPVIPDPAKFIAVGINYRDHADETGRDVAARPSVFARFPDTLLGHRQAMLRPRNSTQLDFEGELAVVIGRGGRHIAERDAFAHVAGYTCFVDGSVRDYQRSSVTAGKNFPSTGPLGPWMVTTDEIPDPAALTLMTRLNGAVMQRSGIDRLIHPIPALIAFVSGFTPLAPGDVIATGTPAGVGHRREPPVWMRAGDHLEVEISGIGVLATHVIDEDPHHAPPTDHPKGANDEP